MRPTRLILQTLNMTVSKTLEAIVDAILEEEQLRGKIAEHWCPGCRSRPQFECPRRKNLLSQLRKVRTKRKGLSSSG